MAGPNFMKNREPYNIKGIMIAYNLFQVAKNTQIFSSKSIKVGE